MDNSVEVKPPNVKRTSTKKRSETRRKQTNHVTNVKRDIDHDLFPEYDSLAATLSSLQVVEQNQAVRLKISTRGIGLTIALLHQRIHARLPNLEIPLNAWYRVTLAQIEAKMFVATQHQHVPVAVPTTSVSTMTADQYAVVVATAINLAPIVLMINSLGNFVFDDVNYYPYLPGGVLSPIFSTLRAYVTAAANANNALAYSACASIPGGTWAAQPPHALQNADAIMPNNYTIANFRADAILVKTFYAAVIKKFPNYSGVINFNPNGSPCQLVSNNSTTNRATCAFIEDDCQMTGQCNQFTSLYPINHPSLVIGMASLFGEFYYQAQTISRSDEPRGNIIASRKYVTDWQDIVNSLIV